jgi:hypothetical protein
MVNLILFFIYVKSDLFCLIFLFLNLLVDSNDTLYGSDPKYLKEVDKTISLVMEKLLNIISKLVIIIIYFSYHFFLIVI